MDDFQPNWPQFLAALGIVVGGAAGTIAAVDTGDFLRYAGTAVFLAITLPLYIWRFHLSRVPARFNR